MALQVFRRVVELESFSRAAEDLHLSNAAVSKNVRELEQASESSADPADNPTIEVNRGLGSSISIRFHRCWMSWKMWKKWCQIYRLSPMAFCE